MILYLDKPEMPFTFLIRDADVSPTSCSPDVKGLCHRILYEPGLEGSVGLGVAKHCPGLGTRGGDVEQLKVNVLRFIQRNILD